MPPDTTAVRSTVPSDCASPESCRRALRTTQEMAAIIDPILDALTASGYTDAERFGVRLALEEALVNAIKHGHDGAPTRCVQLCYWISAERFLAQIEDEGPGFDPSKVADPLDPTNWKRDGGRGLFLMRVT